MSSIRRLAGPLLIVALLLAGPARAQAPAPAGEVAVSFHVTLAPSWFDPSTAPAQITPFGVLYATHDALVRPLPGQKMGPSLAEAPTGSSTSSACGAGSSSTTATRSPPTTSSGASSATRARGPASTGRGCARWRWSMT